MDKKLKIKWLKALRSGRYKQTRGTLYDGKGYCCLGVLCRVAGLKPKNKPKNYEFSYKGETAESFLPKPLAKEVGLRKSTQDRLAFKNDNKHWTFDQIADYVEKRL